MPQEDAQHQRLVEPSQLAGSPSPSPITQPGRRRWLRHVAGAALLVLVLVVSALIALRTEGGWRHAGARMDALRPWFVCLHLLLIGLLAWRWDALVDWLADQRGASDALRAAAKALRGRALLMLLAIEVLVVLQWPMRWFG